MLDSVIRLIEKISEFVKYRQERKARRFKHLIEPTYSALKSVHQDYLSVFEVAITELASTRSLIEVADSLELRRLSEEAERRAVRQLAKTLRESEVLPECRPFFNAVVTYFSHTPLSGQSTPSNMLLNELRDIVKRHSNMQLDKHSEQEQKEKLSQSAAFMLHELRQKWDDVSAEYAEALALSVG